jgi:hypothetical protein
MIKYAESQRNVWTYLIGLGLIALAILVSWLVFRNPPAISLPADAGLSAEVPGSAVIDPADRKFFNAGQTVPPETARGINTLVNVAPADRKFYTQEYVSGSGVSTGMKALTRVDPADRKFFTSGYATGAIVGGEDAANSVHPADRKFFQ